MVKRSHQNENNNSGFINSLNKTRNLVHSQWERKDPTPDIQTLFERFNKRFFKDKLNRVRVVWRTGMTKSSGTFTMDKVKGKRKLIPTIKLSKELLIFESRKYIIEILLHEMIHAYLYLEKIDTEEHGLCFIQMARKIDALCGTNITSYTNKPLAENFYLKHVWHCTGRCQAEQPYFGWFRSKQNFAPGPSKRWFRKHSKNCDGKFIKQTPEMVQKYLTSNDRAIAEDISYQFRNNRLYDLSLEYKYTELINKTDHVEPSWLPDSNNNSMPSIIWPAVPRIHINPVMSSTPIEPKLEPIDDFPDMESTKNHIGPFTGKRKYSHAAKAKQRKPTNYKPKFKRSHKSSQPQTNRHVIDIDNRNDAPPLNKYSNVQSQIDDMMKSQISLARQMTELKSQLNLLIQRL